MVVFEYFYDKMDIFGPKMNEMARVNLEMEDMEEVCLSISVSVYTYVCQSICLSAIYLSLSRQLVYISVPVMRYPPPALNPFFRNLHPSPPSLTPSLARFSSPSVSATTLDCRTERNMKRE